MLHGVKLHGSVYTGPTRLHGSGYTGPHIRVLQGYTGQARLQGPAYTGPTRLHGSGYTGPPIRVLLGYKGMATRVWLYGSKATRVQGYTGQATRVRLYGSGYTGPPTWVRATHILRDGAYMTSDMGPDTVVATRVVHVRASIRETRSRLEASSIHRATRSSVGLLRWQGLDVLEGFRAVARAVYRDQVTACPTVETRPGLGSSRTKQHLRTAQTYFCKCSMCLHTTCCSLLSPWSRRTVRVGPSPTMASSVGCAFFRLSSCEQLSQWVHPVP